MRSSTLLGCKHLLRTTSFDTSCSKLSRDLIKELIALRHLTLNTIPRKSTFLSRQVFGLLRILTVRPERCNKVSEVKVQVAIFIVPSDPIQYVFFLQVIAELEISKEHPQVIWVDGSVSELVDVSKDLQERKFFLAHELLFKGLHSFHRLNLPFTNPEDCMLNIVTYLSICVVQSVSVISLCFFEMVSSRIRQRCNHFLEAVRK